MSIITSLNSEGPIDHQKMANDLAQIYDRKADSLFVIMDEKRTTVVKDPGLSRPWCSPNVRIAEVTAKQIGLETGTTPYVCTLSDAIKLLCGEHVRSQ